jgi:serpin B
VAWSRKTAAALAAAMVLAACGGPADPGGADGQDDKDVFDAQFVTDLTEDEAADLAASINAFGFDLHRALATEEHGNVVTAPVSVAVLLAMVAAGADGETAQQMADVLHVDEVRDNRFAVLLEQLVDTDDVTLDIANALWVDDDVDLLAEYVGWIREAFSAPVEAAALDQRSGADAIDAWVRQNTNDRIQGIAEELGLPDPDVVVVLANAVYFLGRWTTQFDPRATRDGPFRLSDGTVVQVPLMNRTGVDEGDELEVADMSGHRVIRLAYGEDRRFGMEIFVPTGSRTLDEFMASFDHETWAEGVAALHPVVRGIPLSMPTFEMEWGATLNDVLIALGMSLAFDDTGADFSRMSSLQLVLDAVVHKTYIRVDEEGTEAAAVTGGGMAVTSAPEPITIDRSFAFTISDRETSTILFLGTVEDPRG